MITTFKERPSGGFYCAECRMSFGELHTTCPYCGSFISNYEELLIKEENDNIRPMFDIDETGQNKYATGGFISYDDVPPFRGWRMGAGMVEDYLGDELDHEVLKEIVEYVKRKEKKDEDNIYGRN